MLGLQLIMQISLSLLISLNIWAQKVKGTTKYESQFDQQITLKKMTYLNSLDNVNGIYAKAMDDKLETLLKNNHQWDLVVSHVAGAVVKPEDLVAKPDNLKSLAANLGADGLFMAEARKDPEKLSLRLYLFSTRSGELIAEESSASKSDQTASVIDELGQMFQRIKVKIPYDALVISRTDNRITFNAGSKDGVRAGADLNAVVITSAEKHPKRNFIIESRKSILGQVRVVKADDHLSFADITNEIEPGVIGKDVKITGLRSVDYGDTPWTQTLTPPEQLLSENNKSVFGTNSREWVTHSPPTFGKVGADFSLGRFDNNLSLTDSGGSLDTQVLFYPRININGELWFTPKFYASATFSQGLGEAENPLSEGADNLSSSLTQYRLSFGYNFMLQNDFFGPKLTIDVGINNYRMYMDTVSNLGFTTVEYRSLPIGLGGYVPLDPKGEWALRGKAYFHLFPSLRESPYSSGGGPNSTINQFLIEVEKKMSARLRLKMGLEFLLLSTNFDGPGQRTPAASNISHRFTFFNTGIDYLF